MSVLENLDRDKISQWLKSRSEGKRPFFYNSVDIRNSGFKIAPVDTNLFPAGFNNLSEDALKSASQQSKNYFELYYPNVRHVAIWAENFSRNKYYWDNIRALKIIIGNAGFDVSIVVDDPEMPLEVEDSEGAVLKLCRLADATADIFLLNRDFTGGLPKQLLDLKKPIIPTPDMGWHTRRKSRHFQNYDILAKDFANEFGFDPWLISTLHQKCGRINFKEGQGFECLADNANNLLSEIRRKYNEYGIKSDPYLYIKADSGTFGMGIMTIKSILEISEMNKKLRNKMDRIKEGVQNTEVIIQEGVPTIDSIDGKTAEPFLYCINSQPVGAILRINENRDEFGNLNSAGMYFSPVNCTQIAEPCEFSPLGIIARLASLAAVYEAEDMKIAA